MKASKKAFIISIVIMVLGVLSLSIFGLNYGIDFSSGTVVDVSTTKQISNEDAKAFFDEYGENTLTSSPNRLSVRFKEALPEQQELDLKAKFNAQFDEGATYEVNIVDAEIAREQQWKALTGIGLASLGIVIYMAIRFEWRFGVAAVLSLLQVAFLVISIFSIFRLEVNLTFIIAILTIVGYAVNDTVVIFDRIRENLRFAKIKKRADLELLVNTSIWQMLTRSITTALTTFISATCLFIFGSESIRLFSLAMMLGLVFGALSSIFIASPIWVMLRSKFAPKTKKAVKAPSAP
jgi:SecD/SecF fusion protein